MKTDFHPLRQYLSDVGESHQDFALRVGTSRQTLYRLINGDQTPRPALASRIVEATGGAVTFNMLYGDPKRAGADIVGLSRGNTEPLLDYKRMHMALNIVVDHLTPKDCQVTTPLLHIGVEAAVNTYEALSVVTSREGPARLAQALRPVLEEMLQELGVPISASAVDRGADLAAQLYLQTTPALSAHKS